MAITVSAIPSIILLPCSWPDPNPLTTQQQFLFLVFPRALIPLSIVFCFCFCSLPHNISAVLYHSKELRFPFLGLKVRSSFLLSQWLGYVDWKLLFVFNSAQHSTDASMQEEAEGQFDDVDGWARTVVRTTKVTTAFRASWLELTSVCLSWIYPDKLLRTEVSKTWYMFQDILWLILFSQYENKADKCTSIATDFLASRVPSCSYVGKHADRHVGETNLELDDLEDTCFSVVVLHELCFFFQ